MLYAVLLYALFSLLRVTNSDRSRLETYPHQQHGGPSPGRGRIPPVPAVPLPNYVLLTAASAGEFQPDNDLEVTHEFKLRVEARNEMCMFQKVKQNARFYVSFKVRSSVIN